VSILIDRRAVEVSPFAVAQVTARRHLELLLLQRRQKPLYSIPHLIGPKRIELIEQGIGEKVLQPGIAEQLHRRGIGSHPALQLRCMHKGIRVRDMGLHASVRVEISRDVGEAVDEDDGGGVSTLGPVLV